MNFATTAQDAEQLPHTVTALNAAMFAHVAEMVTLAAAVNRTTVTNVSPQITCKPLTSEEITADLLATDVRAQLVVQYEQTELQIDLRADSRPNNTYHLRIHAVRGRGYRLPDPVEWLEIESKVMDELRAHFRPEFLNRVDDVIVFHPLTREDLDQIVALQLGRLRTLVAAKGLVLDVTPAAMSWIADAGYDPLYGARPLKRVIQRELQNPIAMEVLSGGYAEGDTIRVVVAGDQLGFERVTDSGG